MAPQPQLHSEIYPAVDPKNFVGCHKGKVVLVIGSARGIGQGVALSFAKTGATIAAFDLRNIAETVQLCEKEGVKAKGWELDATDEEAVNKAIDEVEEQLGPIDVLCNVAGIIGSRPVLMENYKNFWRVMEVNTGATIISMLKVLPLMKKRRRGCIINVASRSGSLDLPGTLSYSVSKSAVIRATGCVQLELDAEGLGDDIQVYALHPGGVLTDMPKTPMAKDVQEAYPQLAKALEAWLPLFKTSRFLCGAVSVYIAAGKAKILKGRYFDCEQDIEQVVTNGQGEIIEKDLYRMKIDFLGGLPNDGGMAKDMVIEK